MKVNSRSLTPYVVLMWTAITLVFVATAPVGGSPGGPDGQFQTQNGSRRRTPPPPQSPPTVISIAISGTAALTAVGQTSSLTATATLTDGTTQNVTNSSTWASSSSAVATVSSAGLVTAVTAGTATMTATYQGKAGTLGITVSNTPRGPGNAHDRVGFV